MTNQPSVYIRPSQRFYGKYEVVTPQGVIPCHNIATARTIARDNLKVEVNNGK